MLARSLVSASALIALCAGSVASAADLFVPAQFPTIQAAIDAALPGDSVLVAAGTYNERIDFLGKRIALRSLDGPTLTTIDGGSLGTVVTIDGSLLASITGFTIRNGSLPAGSGAGIRITNAQVRILDSVIRENLAGEGDGAGLYAQASQVTIERTTFDANQAATLTLGSGLGAGASFVGSSATITASTFSGNLSFEQGGGALGASTTSVVTITDSTFTGNRSSTTATSGTGNTFGGGGAIALRDAAALTVINSTFTSNTANRGGGGAIMAIDNAGTGASVTITGGTFTQNQCSNTSGGAVRFDGLGTFSVTGATFDNNTAVGAGGGAIGGVADASGPEGGIIANCVFRGNTAGVGGALTLAGRVTIRDSLFENNQAVGAAGGSFVLTGGGGAILTSGGIPLTRIERSTFRNNRVTATLGTANQGGAIRARRTNIEIIDSTFENNSTTENRGGALWLETTSSLARTAIITGCTFLANSTTGTQFQEGGAIGAAGNVAITIDRGTFTNNTALSAGGSIWAETGGSLTISNSSFTGGSSRVGGGILYPAGGSAASVSFSNTSFRNLQAIPNASGQGGDFGGFSVTAQNITLRGVSLENCNAKNHGGFRTSGGSATATTLVENLTVIDCNATPFDPAGSNGGDVGGGEIAGGGTTTVRNITVRDCNAKIYAGLRVAGGVSALLEDATIINNVSTPTPTGGSGDSGGLQISSPSAVARRLRLENNRAKNAGGLLANSSGTFLLEDSVIIANQAIPTATDSSGDGGGARIDAVNTTIRNVRFENNRGRIGAGLHLSGGGASGQVLVVGSTFVNNQFLANSTSTTSGRGGGIFLDRAGTSNVLRDIQLLNNTARRGAGLWTTGVGVSIVNALIAGNAATDRGSGIFIGTSGSSVGAATITTATIANNTGANNTGASGLLVDGCTAAGTIIANSIIRGNTDTAGLPSQIVILACEAVPSLVTTYSNVEGGYAGLGNIDADPAFVSPATGDFALAPGSVSIDAGDSDAVPLGVTFDLAGAPRFVDDPATPDSGGGTTPIVDQGALEFQGGACLADFNSDGQVDFFDYLDYASAFAVEDPSADINSDGQVDFFDFLDFAQAFGNGC
ncbi:MAG: GC-type dockerin domain-anchored protein [Planctomycetota bacterium]|nr:GC-type dockerin domain-anchored protein [Planctomycetota bacterium]